MAEDASRKLARILAGRAIDPALWEDPAVKRVLVERLRVLARYRRGLPDADAEAVALDTVSALWEARERGRYDGRGTVGAYVQGIFGNLAEAARRGLPVPAARNPDGLPSGDPAPADVAVSRERLAELRAAVEEGLSKASPGDREAYRLLAAEDLSPAGAAERLGISTNALHQRVFRARRAIEEGLRGRGLGKGGTRGHTE